MSLLDSAKPAKRLATQQSVAKEQELKGMFPGILSTTTQVCERGATGLSTSMVTKHNTEVASPSKGVSPKSPATPLRCSPRIKQQLARKAKEEEILTGRIKPLIDTPLNRILLSAVFKVTKSGIKEVYSKECGFRAICEDNHEEPWM